MSISVSPHVRIGHCHTASWWVDASFCGRSATDRELYLCQRWAAETYFQDGPSCQNTVQGNKAIPVLIHCVRYFGLRGSCNYEPRHYST